MIRITAAVAFAAAVSLAACQPQKTAEQIAAEQQTAAIKEMSTALGGLAGATGEVDAGKLAAALAASGMNAEMTPEERAQLERITAAMASGQVHPAASAYLAGADKAFAILKDVKDVAGVNAARPQVAAAYAEMAGPAATLKAMSEDDREVAFGSAMTQLIGMSNNVMNLLSQTSYDPDTMQAISKLLDEMPQTE